MDEKRFTIVDKQGSGLTSALQEIVDRQTGVHYLTWQSGYAGGIMSSAVDGIHTAGAVIERFCPPGD